MSGSGGPDRAAARGGARALAADADRARRGRRACRRSSSAPLVDALGRYDLISWDGAVGGVRPGTAALRFARSGVGRSDLVELAQPRMRRLADESGETANLIVPRPAGTEAIAQVDGRHLLGATNWIGRELGLHCTAAGKVFLAFGVAELPDGPLEQFTPATVTDRARLERELEAIRDQGTRRSSTSSSRGCRPSPRPSVTAAGPWSRL